MIVEYLGYDSDWKWHYQAIYWSSNAKQWIYDLAAAGRFLGSDEYWDSRQEVDRATAETLMTAITADMPLPSEAEILEIFHSHES